MRFVTNAALAQKNITYQNLLDTWLMMTSATTAYDLYQAVRIRAVELWACSLANQVTTVELTWVGNASGAYATEKTATDTSVSLEPAHVRTTPGPLSPQGLWQQSANEVAFQLTCPANTVIDVEATFRSRFTAQTAAQNAAVGGVTGTLVNRGLDGIAAATTQIPPVSDGYV